MESHSFVQSLTDWTDFMWLVELRLESLGALIWEFSTAIQTLLESDEPNKGTHSLKYRKQNHSHWRWSIKLLGSETSEWSSKPIISSVDWSSLFTCCLESPENSRIIGGCRRISMLGFRSFLNKAISLLQLNEQVQNWRFHWRGTWKLNRSFCTVHRGVRIQAWEGAFFVWISGPLHVWVRRSWIIVKGCVVIRHCF